MAVTVHIQAGKSDDHAGGTGVFVKDGHLHVFRDQGGSQQTLAIYAPGRFASAEVIVK